MTSAYCSDLSLSSGESLAGTATTAEHWLLVEMGGSWPRDVSADGVLPAPAHDAVTRWLERTPGSRVLFIRRPGRPVGSPVAFVVRAAETTTEVRRIALERPGDLGDVEIERDGDRTDRQLVLVCGHGSRDACCARRGVAVYGALTAELGDSVELWMSSHQGGHRFAANVLVLPVGLHFGRVDPQDAERIVAGAQTGVIELACYRGRTCYPQAAQVAERVLRDAFRLDLVADLQFVGMDGGIIRFHGRDGSEYDVAVTGAQGPSVPLSCGAEPERQESFSGRIV